MELTAALLSPAFAGLVLAHFIADFFLQTNKTCADKAQRHIKSKHLWIHAALVIILSLLTIGFSPKALLCALLIGASHLIIDAIKSYMPDRLSTFIIDQFVHIFLILIAVLLVNPQPLWNIDAKIPYALSAFLLLDKPANILIKKVLANYNVVPNKNNTPDENLQRAGALIGTLERILTTIFVLLSRYEAVGFIIAAKSLLRFRDTDTAKTEYVLIGTLLSFGIALLAGLFLHYIYATTLF